MVVLEPGLWIGGKYRLESPIGDGGMGVVWAATHEQLSRPVALKFLLVDKFCQSGPQRSAAIDRFLREGRTAAQLQSEHVVSVLDVGTAGPDGSLPFLVMERLIGTDLEAVLEQRGALPVNDAVDYVLQACEAMAEAHARHIVHRDLKPANLFLTRRIDGSPLIKVLDFGISKQTIAAGDALSLTGTGQIIGSPLYMSPEQFESSKNVDARADVWSLGVIAFALLTGTHPWGEVESVPELIRRVTLQRALPLSHYRMELPQELAAVIARCLESDRERRVASVRELAAGLSPFASESGRWSATRVQNVKLSFQDSERLEDVPAPAVEPASAQADSPPLRNVSDTVLESPTVLRRALAATPVSPPVNEGGADTRAVRKVPAALLSSSGVLRGMWTRRAMGANAKPSKRRQALFLLASGGVVVVFGLFLARQTRPISEEPVATTQARLSASSSGHTLQRSSAVHGDTVATANATFGSASQRSAAVAPAGGTASEGVEIQPAEGWLLRQTPDAGAPSSAPQSGPAVIEPSAPRVAATNRLSVSGASTERSRTVPSSSGKAPGKRASKRPSKTSREPSVPRIPQQAFPERLPLRSTKPSP